MIAFEVEHAKWKDMATRINEVNDANGWDRPTLETLPMKLMIVVTELDEAVMGSIGLGKDPLNEELADVAIRLLHILESVWPDSWTLRNSVLNMNLYQNIEVSLWPIVHWLCSATEYWRSDKSLDTRISLETALSATRRIARTLGFDLVADIKQKTERNAERGHLHGRAKSAG